MKMIVSGVIIAVSEKEERNALVNCTEIRKGASPRYSMEVFDTPIKVRRAISKSGETPVFLDSTPLFLGKP